MPVDFLAPGSHFERTLFKINDGREGDWLDFEHGGIESSNFKVRVCCINDGVEVDFRYLEH